MLKKAIMTTLHRQGKQNSQFIVTAHMENYVKITM